MYMYSTARSPPPEFASRIECLYYLVIRMVHLLMEICGQARCALLQPSVGRGQPMYCRDDDWQPLFELSARLRLGLCGYRESCAGDCALLLGAGVQNVLIVLKYGHIQKPGRREMAI